MDQAEQDRRDKGLGLWVWLVPAAYLVHVLEEAFGGHGLMEWMKVGGGVDWSLAEFLGSNLVGFAVLCLAAWASRKWNAWRWPLVSGAVIFIANGIWHAAICIMMRSYIPGVLTGLVLYLPLGCIVVYRLRHFMSRRSYIIAIVSGILVHAAVIWFVLQMPGFQMG